MSVVGIAAEALPDSCSKEVRAAWKTAAQQQFVRSIFYWNIQDELLRLFAENEANAKERFEHLQKLKAMYE